jgi:propanediol dehydratase small subunit
MARDDRERAEGRSSKSERAAIDAKSGKSERDAAAKAVIDNMAKLKAMRLAREALQPPAVVKRKAAAAAKPGKKAAEKTPALADWLAGQQSGGRRT